MASRGAVSEPGSLGLLLTAGVLAAGCAAVACGQPPRPEPSPEPGPTASEPCLLQPALVSARDLLVGLLEGIDPVHAPSPTNPDERLVFQHLYETLIRVDCAGEVRPGIAESWNGSAEGRRWRFRLPSDARFWDGRVVSAATVTAAWEEGPAREASRWAGIDSLRADGEREVVVYLDRGRREPPRLLAAPVFAIARRSPDSPWPVGTGRYRVEDAGVGAVNVVPTVGGGPRISFTSADHRDERDLLDRGVDLLVTSNPAVIEYAGRLDYERIELPWDRTYLLLSTTRVQALRLGGGVGHLPARLLDSLARDAVRGDARGHENVIEAGGDFWEHAEACGGIPELLGGLPPVPRGAYASSGARRVLYDAPDPVARNLAERLAALAGAGPGTAEETVWLSAAIPGLGDPDERVVVEGMSRADLEDSLREGDDFAYIVSVPHKPLDTCYERRRLVGRAQWLGAEELDLASAVLPLVDTRRHALARPGRIGLRLGWAGDVSIETVATHQGERR